jgi:hypothetical protein
VISLKRKAVCSSEAGHANGLQTRRKCPRYQNLGWRLRWRYRTQGFTACGRTVIAADHRRSRREGLIEAQQHEGIAVIGPSSRFAVACNRGKSTDRLQSPANGTQLRVAELGGEIGGPRYGPERRFVCLKRCSDSIWDECEASSQNARNQLNTTA